MNNYASKVNTLNVLEALEREGILIRTIDRIAGMVEKINLVRPDEKIEMRDIVQGMANTSYIERTFRKRYGDATIMSKNNGYYRIRMMDGLREIDRTEYIDTLLHELAHVIDFMLRGRSNHDSTWKSIASHVGATPEACKEMSKELREKTQKYKWDCSNDSCSFFTTFNRRKKGHISQYRCPHCHSDLVDSTGAGGYMRRRPSVAA